MQLLYQLSYAGPNVVGLGSSSPEPESAAANTYRTRTGSLLERETGFEPATLSLEG